jgi:hypothetical protein
MDESVESTPHSAPAVAPGVPHSNLAEVHFGGGTLAEVHFGGTFTGTLAEVLLGTTGTLAEALLGSTGTFGGLPVLWQRYISAVLW